ncbi:MAG: response regulator [Chloroflexi bacterium CFX4]|nr:response regulator [Chloroflexi bacterium CFX4]MDL1923000.1 response regulator [Chloroflexi bacterium CFX3]
MNSSHALIIDDNQLNIDVLVMLLTQQGITYTAVRSTKEALAILDNLPPLQVVFLDLEFPNGNGFNLIGSLSAHPNLHGVPIVAYSVHTSEIERVRQHGFHSFLGKPLDVQRFPDQLARILSGQSVWEV